MVKRRFKFFICCGLALLMPCLLSAQGPQERQDYVIGKGDLLFITFWQRPDFNTESRVTAAGSIDLPLIGAIQAAGLTLAKLRDNIVSRISLLDVRVTQATVIVREYASKTVYVTGAVLAPGKKSFDVMPNLWQIILEAGGPRPTASLNDVTIIRGAGEEAGKTIRVDLAAALESGDFASLPPVYSGDNVNIPGSASLEGGVGLEPPLSLPNELRNVVHVFGQVVKPGVLALNEDMDLFDALVLAGGPTPAADLKDVRLYFRGHRQAEVAAIDVEHYMKHSTPLPLRLHAGDAIYVPAKRVASSFVQQTLRILFTSTASFILFRVLNR